MKRELSKAPTWMVENMQKMRQTCDTCTPPPQWKVEHTSNLDNEQEMQGLPAGPEVSYGIPFRWSASRVLAKEAKRILCGLHHAGAAEMEGPASYHNNTAACLESVLRNDSWSMQNFMQVFLGQSEGLMREPPSPGAEGVRLPILEAVTGARTSAQSGADELALWQGTDAGWVGCNQVNGTCYGTIPKSVWYSKDKAGTCVDTFQSITEQGFINATSVGIDLCDLNADLANLCQVLKVAQTMVFEANCLYSGACQKQVYAYLPSMYSTTNEEFVGATVSRFYEMYGPGKSSLGAFELDAQSNEVSELVFHYRSFISSFKTQSPYIRTSPWNPVWSLACGCLQRRGPRSSRRQAPS